jgi:hypothetical protein
MDHYLPEVKQIVGLNDELDRCSPGPNKLPTSFQPAGATSQNWMKMYKKPLRIVGKDHFPYTNPMKKRALTLDSEQDEDVPRPGR